MMSATISFNGTMQRTQKTAGYQPNVNSKSQGTRIVCCYIIGMDLDASERIRMYVMYVINVFAETQREGGSKKSPAKNSGHSTDSYIRCFQYAYTHS